MRRRLVALTLLAMVIVLTVPAKGAAFEIEDHETVYGLLSADGTPRDVTVVDWLRVLGSGEITVVDPGDLTDVRNVKGPERPEKVPGGLSWQIKSHGTFRDIFYSGRTNRSLPVEIKITYSLNGKEIPGSQVGGAKGELLVKMAITNRLRAAERITYTNAQGEQVTAQEEVIVPLVVSVTTDVDSRQFRRIEAPDATTVAAGSTVKVSWIVFPYPSSVLTLRLTGDRLRLEPLNFTVAPKVPPLPALDVRDQLVQMVEGQRAIQAGLGEVAGGAETLVRGQGELAAGLSRLQAGVADLSRLNEAHQQIVSRTVEGLSGLDLDQLSGALGRLQELEIGLWQLEGGLFALNQLNGAHQQIIGGIRTELDKLDMATLEKGLASLDDMSRGVRDADRYLNRAAASYASQTRMAKAAQECQNEISDTLERLRLKNPALASGAEYKELKRLLDVQRDNLNGVYNGGREGGKSYDGMSYTSRVLDGLAKKMQESKDNLGVLSELSAKGADMLGAFERFKEALRVLAVGGTIDGKSVPGLDTASEGLAKARSGVLTIGAGLSGSGEQEGLLPRAQQGLALLRAALDVLLHGGTIEGQKVPGLDTAGAGLAEVADGLRQVKDGGDQSRTGAVQLRDGVVQVRTQGVQRMYQEMSVALDGLTKAEAIKKIAAARVQAYDHFIGKPAGARSEVRFLLRTETLR